MQRILTMETAGDQLTSGAIGWGLVDGNTWPLSPRVGFSYPSPAAAMADGWRVMGPPLAMGDGIHEWWMEQNKETT